MIKRKKNYYDDYFKIINSVDLEFYDLKNYLNKAIKNSSSKNIKNDYAARKLNVVLNSLKRLEEKNKDLNKKLRSLLIDIEDEDNDN